MWRIQIQPALLHDKQYYAVCEDLPYNDGWHTVQKNAEFIDRERECNVVDSFCVGVFDAES